MATIDVITTVITAATSTPPAGPYDLVDLDTVKLELGIPDSDASNDPWLQATISRVSETLARHCNRVFAIETVKDQVYYLQDPYPWQVPGGSQPLRVSRWPLITTPFTGNIAAVGATTITGISSMTGLVTGIPVADLNANATTVFVGVLAPGTMITAKGSNQVTISPASVGAGTGLSFLAGFTASVADPTANELVAIQDYSVDQKNGLITRVWSQTGYPMTWEAAPTTAIYQAGYATIPADLVDAVLRWVTWRFAAKGRDPTMRAREQAEQGREEYWVGGPPMSGAVPAEIAGIIDHYRVPMVA